MALLLIAALGACTSSGGSPSSAASTSTPGKDDPLPIRSKADSEAWARQTAERVAQNSGVVLDPASARPRFSPCYGKNGGSASDGRYFLMYNVVGAASLSQHGEAVRKARDLLKAEGLHIDGYRETYGDHVDALVDATHPERKYFVSLQSSTGRDIMSLSVYTPCLIPPLGDRQ